MAPAKRAPYGQDFEPPRLTVYLDGAELVAFEQGEDIGHGGTPLRLTWLVVAAGAALSGCGAGKWADEVDVADRVEREPSGIARGRVAAAQRHPAVRDFVDHHGEHERGDGGGFPQYRIQFQDDDPPRRLP